MKTGLKYDDFLKMADTLPTRFCAVYGDTSSICPPKKRPAEFACRFKKMLGITISAWLLLLCSACSRRSVDVLEIHERSSYDQTQTSARDQFKWQPLENTVLTNTAASSPDPLLAATHSLMIQSSNGLAGILGAFNRQNDDGGNRKAGTVTLQHDGEVDLRCKFQLNIPAVQQGSMTLGLYAVSSTQTPSRSIKAKGYKLLLPLVGGQGLIIKDFGGGSVFGDDYSIYRMGGELGKPVMPLGNNEHELHFHMIITNEVVVISSYLDDTLLAVGIDTPELDSKHDEIGNFRSFDTISISAFTEKGASLRLDNVSLIMRETLPSTWQTWSGSVLRVVWYSLGGIGLLLSFWLGWKLIAGKTRAKNILIQRADEEDPVAIDENS